MHTVIITFRLAEGIGDAQYREAAAAARPLFHEVPGLHSKTWLADPGSGIYGGVYRFASPWAADAYLASDLFAEAVADNPALEDVMVRRADVLDVSAGAAGHLPAPLVPR